MNNDYLFFLLKIVHSHYFIITFEIKLLVFKKKKKIRKIFVQNEHIAQLLSIY